MKRLFKRAIMICIVLFLVLTAINLYVIKSVQPYIYKDMAKVPTRDVVIVLGAALREGKPSPVLEDRVKAGIYLYEKGQVKKILLSGDHGRVEHDEVNSMREYILEHEKTIEKADIFLDHAGFDTYNTMYRAKEIFQIKNAVIVTQDFHINRAVYTARMLGIDAVGYSVDQDRFSRGLQMKWSTREFASRVKAFLDTRIHRKPKFLGEKIPITGDGRNSWDKDK